MIIFENISHEECQSRKVVFAPMSVYGPVDDISAPSLLPLAGNKSWPGFQGPSLLLIGQSWLARCSQLLGDCMRRRHLREESTNEVKEKPAIADFAEPKH